MPKTVTISTELVQDLVNYIATKPLNETLVLFNRVVQETQGQIAPAAPKTDVDVPAGKPAKPKK